MVRFEICATNEHWGKYTDFYLEHRERIIPKYQVKHAIKDVIHCIKHGRAALLTDENDRTIGIGGFVLGLEEQGFRAKEIAVLNNCFFSESHQGNRTFIRGLQVLAGQIADMSKDVKEVRIPTPASSAYTNGLYRKIAGLHHAFDTSYGTFNVYATPFNDFVSFCNRFLHHNGGIEK